MLFCKCYFHHNANICWAPPRRNDNKCVKRYLQLDRYLYCLNWKHLEYTLKIITSLCFCATSLIILFFMWHRSRFQEIYWCLESVYEMWFFRSRCNARACLLVKLTHERVRATACMPAVDSTCKRVRGAVPYVAALAVSTYDRPTDVSPDRKS